MSDFAAVLSVIGCALLLSPILRWLQPGWTPLRTSMIAASVAPVILVALCVCVYVQAANTPPERCGVDACGMAMLSAMVVGGLAVAGFLIGWLASFLSLKLLIRR